MTPEQKQRALANLRAAPEQPAEPEPEQPLPEPKPLPKPKPPPVAAPDEPVSSYDRFRMAAGPVTPQVQQSTFAPPPVEQQKLNAGQYATGQYAKSPQAYENELSRIKTSAALRRSPEAEGEDRQALIDNASASAESEIKGVSGYVDSRRNLIIGLDEPKMLQDIKDGNTWAGWLSGTYPLTKAVKDAAPYADNIVPGLGTGMKSAIETAQEMLAPWQAIAQPGWTSFDAANPNEAATPKREGVGWWLTRMSLLQPVWQIGFNRLHGGDMKWGSDEQLKDLQSYDVVQEAEPLGKALYPWIFKYTPPGLAGQAMEKVGLIPEGNTQKVGEVVSGLAAVTPFLLVPDSPLDLLPAGLGYVGKRVFKAGTLINAAAVVPALKGIERMREAVKAGEGMTAALEGAKGAEKMVIEKAINKTYAEVTSQGISNVRLNMENLKEVQEGLATALKEAEESAVTAARGTDAAADALHEARLGKDAAVDLANRYVVGKAAVETAKQALDEVVKLASGGAVPNAKEMMGLIEDAKGSRRTLKTIDQRLDRIAKRMEKVVDIGEYADLNDEVQNLLRLRTGISAKMMKTANSAAFKTAEMNVKAAEAGFSGLQTEARKLGLDPKWLDSKIKLPDFFREAEIRTATQDAKKVAAAQKGVASADLKLDKAVERLGEAGRKAKLVESVEEVFLKKLDETERDIRSFQKALLKGDVAEPPTLIKNLHDELISTRQPVRELLTKPGLARWFLSSMQYLGLLTDAIKQKGFEYAPEAIREWHRAGINWIGEGHHELDEMARGGWDNVWKFLETDEALPYASRATITNRAMPHDIGFYEYLRAIAGAGEEAFGNDVTVKALANAWQAPGKAGDIASSRAISDLYKYVVSNASGAKGLKNHFLENMKRIWGATYQVTEGGNRALRDYARAMVAGSGMYRSLKDWQRLTLGLHLDADTAKSMKFFADPQMNTSVGTVKSLDNAERAAAELGIPLKKTIKGRDFSRNVVGGILAGTRNQNRMLDLVGKLDGSEVWMPEQFHKALQEIPVKLAKELEQFHPYSFLGNAIRNYLRTWRVAVLFGNPGMFLRSAIGDWSNMVIGDGLTHATKVAGKNLVANVPVIGRRLQDLNDPRFAALARGDGRVALNTRYGAIPSDKYLERFILDGGADNIGSGEFKELTARVEASSFGRRMLDILAGQDVPKWMKAVHRMFEDVQFRQRLLYHKGLMESGATWEDAKKQLSLVLYDYRTGATDLEINTVGQAAAFWVWTRNWLRQLGMGFVEPLTNPKLSHLMGNSPLGRTVRAQRMSNAVADSFSWEDEYALDDSSQDRLGREQFPWFAANKHWIFNRPVGSEKSEWYQRVQGKRAKVESYVLNSLTFANNISFIDKMAQMAGLAMHPANTTHPAYKDIAGREINSFSENFVPIVSEAIDGGVKSILGVERRGDAETPMQQDQAVAVARLMPLLHKWGMDDFIVYENGKPKIDDSVYGMMFKLLLANPTAAAALKNWRTVDNPGATSDPVTWMLESLLRASGLVTITGEDPNQSRKFEVEAQQRKMKQILSNERDQLKSR